MEDLFLSNRNKKIQGDHIILLEFPQLLGIFHIFLEKPSYLLQFVSINPLEQLLFNRRCLVRFTHLWYQIFPSSWLGSWHLPQFILSLGNHIVDLWGQNWGQHSGFSEENHPQIGFFWKLQKMKFPAFGFKNWDFFWVGGMENGLTNFFQCQKA